MPSQLNNPLTRFFRNTFSSLKVRNFRLYFIGQAISVSGTFMQAVAQAWLILKLTHSGTALGLVTALQFLPILIFGPWGGVITDRYDKRTLLIITQIIFGVQALVLGFLVLTGLVQIWMVGVLAFIYGMINVIDNPTRQTFVPEMVGNERLRNAVTLYTSLVNSARVTGPILAAVLIATVGIGMCFIINGISYVAIIFILLTMNTKHLYHTERAIRARGQLVEGLRYILTTPLLRNTLLIMAIIGTLTYEFQVSLPLIAEFTFHGNVGTYAILMSAQGIGSVIGGLILAGRKNASVKSLIIAALLFGISTSLAAFSPWISVMMFFIFMTGIFSIYFLSLGSTILQLESDPKMRGRVMAYWSMAFMGSTAIGGPIVGWIGQNIDPRWGLNLGGIAAIVASIIGFATIKEMQKKTSPQILNQSELTADDERRVL